MTSVRVHSNFRGDLQQQMAAHLRKAGCRVPTGADAHPLCGFFYNANQRMIAPQRRRVERSPELATRQSTLPRNQQTAIQTIERACVCGRPVNPYLSERLVKPGYSDRLLYDWAIHHLHLGTPTRRGAFVGRTNELLFVYLDRDAAYLLDVRPHGAWSDRDLVEILHRNWPDVLDRHRVRTATALGTPGTPGTPITDADRERARRAGLTMLTQMADGTLSALLSSGNRGLTAPD